MAPGAGAGARSVRGRLSSTTSSFTITHRTRLTICLLQRGPHAPRPPRRPIRAPARLFLPRGLQRTRHLPCQAHVVPCWEFASLDELRAALSLTDRTIFVGAPDPP